MTVLKGDEGKALELFGDALSNPLINSNQVEIEKDALLAEHGNNHTNYKKTLLENVYFNAYREHMIGQPRKGDADSISGLNESAVREYVASNYFGDNMVIAVAGNVSHDQVVDMVERNFSKVPKTAPSSLPRLNTEKPAFIPALLFIRDDEMVNSNVGIAYDAPHLGHEDYYGFQLLQRIFGNYRLDKNAEHLNDMKKQYNSMHAMIGDLPDVTRHDCMYQPHSDSGLLIHYFYGNEVFTRQMNYCGMSLNTIYGHYVRKFI
jgi:predicted Zn-dependent peptidase